MSKYNKYIDELINKVAEIEECYAYEKDVKYYESSITDAYKEYQSSLSY